jgi:hypothetical protein
MEKRTLVLNRPIRIQLLAEMDRYNLLSEALYTDFLPSGHDALECHDVHTGLGSVIAMGVSNSTTRVGGEGLAQKRRGVLAHVVRGE